MTEYTPTIGLEIHAELKTRTKMFCDSPNDPDETRPNVNVCPVCMGHPGTLPTINKEAVRQVLRVGVAVGGTLADFSEFDRKNYFYPDIPKGYQISQYKYPFVSGGSLNGVALTRIHLEEDTALSKHEGEHSLVDFNRAGIPLMELVTEPVLHSAEEATAFAKELRLLLRTLSASDADMEKGHLRLEANISVASKRAVGLDSELMSNGLNADSRGLGTKVEVKNLNSFRALERAIQFETKRQSELLDAGGEVVQETRGWDEAKQKTFSQRSKEDSHDYRYFPEPDLPKMTLSEIPEFSRDALAATLPELPWQKRERYAALGVSTAQADILVKEERYAELFDNTVRYLVDDRESIQRASNYLISDVIGMTVKFPATGVSEDMLDVVAKNFAKLMVMVKKEELSSRGAKEILQIIFSEECDNPETIAKEKKLLQKSDAGELRAIAEKVLAENASAVEEYKQGKESALQFLVGAGMKATRGSANPQVFAKLLKELILSA